MLSATITANGESDVLEGLDNFMKPHGRDVRQNELLQLSKSSSPSTKLPDLGERIKNRYGTNLWENHQTHRKKENICKQKLYFTIYCKYLLCF